MQQRRGKPTAEELRAARELLLPDVLGPDLDVVFCGINPSLYSAATGHHFARPGNRFWPALHRSGFTDRLLTPAEDRRLLDHGGGLTNLAARATARADEIGPQELAEGYRILVEKVARLRPRAIAFLGLGAFRTAFGLRAARIEVGRQPQRIGDAAVWALPNPSGLNAHYQLPDFAALFAALRDGVRKSNDAR